MAKKAGRPAIEIDKKQFENLCGLQCTEEEIAAWFKCSIDTIDRWCKRTYETNFADIYKVYSANGKISLRRTQLRLAEKSAAMAIFLGKNMLGQTDKVEQVITEVEDLSPLAALLTDKEDGDTSDTND